MSWDEPPSPPKPKPNFRRRPPPSRRSFEDGDLVRLRNRPELVGQVIIPARAFYFPRHLPDSSIPRLRVKVIWETSAGPREWIYEDDLMAIDLVTELGRLA